MNRLMTHAVIAVYLSALLYGLVCHALYYRTDRHPAMYFLVWDMFCGWSAYETRVHLIGEGESGQFYELSPPPWGEVTPFGQLGRRHYDYHGLHAHKIALNTLRHTDHEPMTRLFVVEEAWPRKYNLPDELWQRRYSEPKDPHSYYQVRTVLGPDGGILERRPVWLARVTSDCVMDNPRLRADLAKGRPFYAVQPQWSKSVQPVSHESPARE